MLYLLPGVPFSTSPSFPWQIFLKSEPKCHFSYGVFLDFHGQIYHLILSASLALCSWCYSFAIIFPTCGTHVHSHSAGNRREGIVSSLPPSVSPCPEGPIDLNYLGIDKICPFFVPCSPCPDSGLCPSLSPCCQLSSPITHTFPTKLSENSLSDAFSLCLKSVPGSPSQQDNPKRPTIYDLTLSNSPALTFDILPCFLDSSDTELIVIPQALCCFLLPCFSSRMTA